MRLFSIPVDFSAKARTELLEAAECIGIAVKGFVSESSAAYISKIKDIKGLSKVMVGTAITSAIDCDFKLSDDICILLSDGEVYPILKKDVNKVGDKSEAVSFSMTTYAYDAHFIFTDSTGKNRYATISVNAKGYVDEKFDLTVKIGKDQIARAVIKNDYISAGYRVEHEINKLRFYYDLKDVEE